MLPPHINSKIKNYSAQVGTAALLLGIASLMAKKENNNTYFKTAPLAFLGYKYLVISKALPIKPPKLETNALNAKITDAMVSNLSYG